MGYEVSFESLAQRTVPGELQELLGVRVVRSGEEWERVWGALSNIQPELRDPVPAVEWSRSMAIVAAGIVADTAYRLDIASVVIEGTRLRVEARRTRDADFGAMVLSTAWHVVTAEALEFEHAELVDGDGGR